MRGKLFSAITLAILSAIMLVSATAQNRQQGNIDPHPRPEAKPNLILDKKISIGTQVKLQCTVGTPVEFPTVTITNNTSETVPQGKKVYWQVNSAMKGSLVLQSALTPGKSVKFSTEAQGNGGQPTAYYFK